jgi:hypothetical protein
MNKSVCQDSKQKKKERFSETNTVLLLATALDDQMEVLKGDALPGVVIFGIVFGKSKPELVLSTSVICNMATKA